MSTVATEMKVVLDALGTLGTIRVGSMDPLPYAIGAIYEYSAQMGDGQFGVQGVKYEKPAIQVSFRGDPNDYETPMTRCTLAYRRLSIIQPGSVGGTQYLTVVPQGVPHSLGKDKNQCFEIVCNFYITKEQS